MPSIAPANLTECIGNVKPIYLRTDKKMGWGGGGGRGNQDFYVCDCVIRQVIDVNSQVKGLSCILGPFIIFGFQCF